MRSLRNNPTSQDQDNMVTASVFVCTLTEYDTGIGSGGGVKPRTLQKVVSSLPPTQHAISQAILSARSYSPRCSLVPGPVPLACVLSFPSAVSLALSLSIFPPTSLLSILPS